MTEAVTRDEAAAQQIPQPDQPHQSDQQDRVRLGLAELPLFAAAPPPREWPRSSDSAPPRPGRVRSTFSLQPQAPRGPETTQLDGDSPRSLPAALRPVSVLPSWAAAGAVGERVPDAGGVDWSMVAVLRAQASQRLSTALGEDRARLDRQAQQELGRAVILELLQ